MRKSHGKKKRKSLLQNPIVLGALITGIVGILTALVPVALELIRQGRESSEPPFAAVSGLTLTIPTETLPAPTSAVTPTATLPVFSTLTPEPELPTLDCLSLWFRVDSAKIPTPTPEATAGATAESPDGCDAIPELGISTTAKGLIYSKDDLRDEHGIFGISRSIKNGYEINLTVITNQLFNAEFWVALSTQPTPLDPDINPEVVSMVIVPAYQSNPKLTGTIVVFRNAEKKNTKRWEEIILKNNVVGPPFTYEINIKVTGGSVVVTVNNREVADEKGIFPRYLFLGYYKKSASGSVIVDVNVSDLRINTGQ